MDEPKRHHDGETSLTRRSFLVGLGKWSAIVVATVTAGIPAMGLAKEGIQAPPDERIPGLGREENDVVEQRWCRVWGHGGGCRVWGNAGGCRVWGNAGGWTCRVWGHAGGCRVWGHAGGCRVWGHGGFRR